MNNNFEEFFSVVAGIEKEKKDIVLVYDIELGRKYINFMNGFGGDYFLNLIRDNNLDFKYRSDANTLCLPNNVSFNIDTDLVIKLLRFLKSKDLMLHYAGLFSVNISFNIRWTISIRMLDQIENIDIDKMIDYFNIKNIEWD